MIFILIHFLFDPIFGGSYILPTLGFLLAGSSDFTFWVFVETTIRSLKVKLLGGVQKPAKNTCSCRSLHLMPPALGIISLLISEILPSRIFGNQPNVFVRSSVSLLGSLVWGHYTYTGLETGTGAYFTGTTVLVSNWYRTFYGLFTNLGNPPVFHLKKRSVDQGFHDTFYVVAHFHFVLSLGAAASTFSGMF